MISIIYILLLVIIFALTCIQLWITFKVKIIVIRLFSELNEDNSSKLTSNDESFVDSNDGESILALNNQLKKKSIEIVKLSKEIDEKNELLNVIGFKAKDSLSVSDTNLKLSHDIIELIDSAKTSNDSIFGTQIDELNNDFINKIKNKFPDLTIHDVRLATYIRLGMNSKEISKFLKIKSSSVYISRSRLRKKMGLDTDTDLHGYLNNFK